MPVDVKNDIVHKSWDDYLEYLIKDAHYHNVIVYDSDDKIGIVTDRLIEMMVQVYTQMLHCWPTILVIPSDCEREKDCYSFRHTLDVVKATDLMKDGKLINWYDNDGHGTYPNTKTRLCVMIGHNGALLGAF